MSSTVNKIEEMLDLVDENDKVIGQITRTEANSSSKFLHRIVGVMIYDSEERMLIQQRSKRKKLKPGYWIVSAAGHVPSGISPMETAHKELQEELGFDADLRFVEKEKVHGDTQSVFIYWYLGKCSGQPITIDQTETEQFRFVSQSDLESMISTEQIEESCLRIMEKLWSNKMLDI